MLQVTLQVMKHIFSGELAQRLPGILGLLQELARQETGLEFLYTVLRYVSQSGRNVTAADIQQAVVTVFPEEGAVLMATAAEQWMERGKEQGIVIGKQEGERNGLLAAIELGLELKFGATGLQLLPAIYHVTDLDVLRALYKGVKVAQSLAEFQELYRALTAEAQA